MHYSGIISQIRPPIHFLTRKYSQIFSPKKDPHSSSSINAETRSLFIYYLLPQAQIITSYGALSHPTYVMHVGCHVPPATKTILVLFKPFTFIFSICHFLIFCVCWRVQKATSHNNKFFCMFYSHAYSRTMNEVALLYIIVIYICLSLNGHVFLSGEFFDKHTYMNIFRSPVISCEYGYLMRAPDPARCSGWEQNQEQSNFRRMYWLREWASDILYACMASIGAGAVICLGNKKKPNHIHPISDKSNLFEWMAANHKHAPSKCCWCLSNIICWVNYLPVSRRFWCPKAIIFRETQIRNAAAKKKIFTKWK